MGTQKKKQHSVTEEIDKEKRYSLFLHNDDFHSFDYVIDALMDICNHSNQQATQCTYLVHFKGKCDIKPEAYAPGVGRAKPEGYN